MIENPYAQVALTYVHRPLASWVGRGASLWVLFMLALGVAFFLRGHGTPPGLVFFFFLMPYCLLFLFLAVHMKDQFAESRARLTPGFRRAHVTIATIAILVSTMLLPATVSLVHGLRSVGLVAAVLLLFDVILWQSVLNSTWLIWLLTVGVFGMMTDTAGNLLWGFVSGKHELLAVALLLVGVAICWQGMRRLVRLTEDDPKSYRRIQWDRSGRIRVIGHVPAGGGSLGERLRNWAIDRDMAALTQYAQRSPASWWSRVCRWQIGMVAPSSVGSLCIFIFIYLQLLTWLFGPGALGPDRREAIVPGAFMFFMLPAFVWFGQFAVRWPMMGREMLLPVTRRDYVRQWVLAAAWSNFRLCSGLTATVAIWWLVNAKEPMHSGLFVRVLSFAAVVQVLLFGVIIWASRFRSRALAIAAIFGVLLPAQMIVTMGLAGPIRLPQHWLAPAGVFFAVVGVLFAWRGYRRWLNVDFD